jgi:hypothetical protein
LSDYNCSAFGRDQFVSGEKINRINCEGRRRRNGHQVAYESLRSQGKPLKYKTNYWNTRETGYNI